MKVLVVAPAYQPATRFGGPVKSIHDTARSLVERGVEVTVFTTNSNGPGDLDVPLGKPVDVDGVEVEYFPVQVPRSYFYAPALGGALRQRVHRFDVVYAAWMYVYTTWAATRACRAQGIPYVLSPRGMLDRNAVRQKGHLKKRIYLSLVGTSMLGDATAVHFTSEGERENSIVRVDEHRSLVIPNGLDLKSELAATNVEQVAGLELPQGGPMVLFLGRLSYIKGLDQLVRAWPGVVRAIPDAHLVLAGPDDDGLYASLRREIEASNVERSITYVGLIGSAVKGHLLERCALLANPSLLESFGMAIVEAMAHSKPVLVSDRVNIARDIVACGAGVMTRCDASEIAQAIVALINDPARRSAMGAAGLAMVRERYALDATAARMGAALAALAGARSTPRKTESIPA